MMEENGTYLHEYRDYDQAVRAFSSFCVVCVQLVIVVDQLNLELKKKTLSKSLMEE